MIQFDERTHTYSLDGKTLISVTQLMKKHGLAPDYSGVSEAVLNAKAERGTLIHKEIEAYNKTGEIGFSAELGAYIDHITKEGLRPLWSEQIVHNDIVAGTLDVFLDNDEKDETIMADLKTTATLNMDAVSWQLSIYEYLSGVAMVPENRERNKLQAFHFQPDGTLKAVDIPRKPLEEIERLMQCERDGVLFQQNLAAIVTDQQIAAIAAAENIIAEAEYKKKAAEARIAEIKSAMMKAMEENAVKTFETDKIKVTYVLPSERTTIDNARLKKEMPEIAEKFSKTTKTAASLRITIKKED